MTSATRFAACTIVAHNYVPLARILADSFLDHHPEATFYIVVVDRPIDARLLRGERFQVLPITEIDFSPDTFEPMATMYDVTEFATSVKPFALRQLLRDHECVMYIDPDIKLYQRLDPLIESTFEAGWSLTPHCLKPIPQDGTSPTEREIMQSGVYNLGYVGVARKALPFLDWWCERLRRHAIIEPEQQLFTDQRWVDLAVPLFSPHIEQSPAYNVAYWNIDQRRLWHDGEKYMVDDEPLGFFHFSGYDPDMPYWLSKYFPGTPRVLLSDHPVLTQICNEYRDQLLQIRKNAGPSLSYGWGDAFPGVPLTRPIRRIYRQEVLNAEADGSALPPTPFLPDGPEQFLDWLTTVPADSPRNMPRFLSAVYGDRIDVQRVYPEAAWGQLEGFHRWVQSSGRHQYPFVQILGDRTPSTQSWSHADDVGRSSGGIDLVGYLNAELGLGEAGRLASSALVAADVPVSAIAFRRTPSRQAHPFEATGVGRNDIVLLAVNADQTGVVKSEFGPEFFAGRYTIGQWFWELEEFPRDQHHSFGDVNEVWAATAHIRDSLAKHAPPSVSVQHMPLPLVAPMVKPDVARSEFGLDDRFTFLFTFDLLSVFDRKNPLGLVEAFTRAFRRDEGPRLLIKSINGHRHIKSLERLRWACRDRPDITVLDQYLDHGMSGALTQACDCYVSLHRAEGLGLTMSEAMSLGKPVIATAYSGNLDFMTDETALLIPWTPAKVGDDAAPYAPGAIWAEPDLDCAAAAMRRVVEDTSFATRLGEAARRDLELRFSPAVTGARMRQRLIDIRRFNNA